MREFCHSGGAAGMSAGMCKKREQVDDENLAC
jgi:hypothetical protein